MPAELIVQAHYSDAADQVFARARSFADMVRASWPLTRYDGLPRTDMEEGRTYFTDISILGFIRVPSYRIEIERLCSDNRIMESREGGSNVRSWNHTLTVEEQADGACWTDRVFIDAGASTFVVAQFARLMYMARHRSRRAALMAARIQRL